MLRTGTAVAAIDGDARVGRGHITRVAPMALRHRLRRRMASLNGNGACP